MDFDLIIFVRLGNNTSSVLWNVLKENEYQYLLRMKKLAVIILISCLSVNLSCVHSENKNGEKIVLIETEYGNIKIKLYNETPLHRDNFIKLINAGFYTDLLFHRVIQNFMIQGGDPDSKNAKPGVLLGGGDLKYTLPAEINPKYFHKRGVIAAARQGDDINPEKRSSGAQFYILQGRVFREDELDSLQLQLEDTRKMNMMQAKIKAVQAELYKLGKEGNQDELMKRYNALKEEVVTESAKLPSLKFTYEQRKAYTSIGGYPSLDNNYTVFGEVIEGMGVVDNIASQPTDKNNRPIKDIRFKVTVL